MWFSWLAHRWALGQNMALFRIQICGNLKIQLTSPGKRVLFQKSFPKWFSWKHIQFIKHKNMNFSHFISYVKNWKSMKIYISDQKNQNRAFSITTSLHHHHCHLKNGKCKNYHTLTYYLKKPVNIYRNGNQLPRKPKAKMFLISR